MKKFISAAILMFASFIGMNGQTVGYVNTDKILDRIPEYVSAKSILENQKAQLDAKLEAEYKKIELMYKSYQSQRSSMSEVQRVARENDIIRREKEVKELQASYFGQDGQMAKRSKELIDPIKNRVQKAINEVADESRIAIVFDLAVVQGVIYNNPNADLTSKVIRKLGIK